MEAGGSLGDLADVVADVTAYSALAMGCRWQYARSVALGFLTCLGSLNPTCFECAPALEAGRWAAFWIKAKTSECSPQPSALGAGKAAAQVEAETAMAIMNYPADLGGAWTPGKGIEQVYLLAMLASKEAGGSLSMVAKATGIAAGEGLLVSRAASYPTTQGAIRQHHR
jgi:hypothetical protein